MVKNMGMMMDGGGDADLAEHVITAVSDERDILLHPRLLVQLLVHSLNPDCILMSLFTVKFVIIMIILHENEYDQNHVEDKNYHNHHHDHIWSW